MEPDRIKKLLEKYWEAETTEEEEAELQKYFAGTDRPQNHPADALFDYFKEERGVMIPKNVDERLNSVAAEKTHRLVWLSPLLKIAAVLLIVFSIVYLFFPSSKPTPMAARQKDTFDDPQQAYLETKKALLLISHQLSTGENYISEIGKINKAEQLINSNEKK